MAPVVNPADGQVFDTVPEATKGDLEIAVQGSKEAFKTWSNMPYAERAGRGRATAARRPDAPRRRSSAARRARCR